MRTEFLDERIETAIICTTLLKGTSWIKKAKKLHNLFDNVQIYFDEMLNWTISVELIDKQTFSDKNLYRFCLTKTHTYPMMNSVNISTTFSINKGSIYFDDEATRTSICCLDLIWKEISTWNKAPKVSKINNRALIYSDNDDLEIYIEYYKYGKYF